MLAGFPLVPVFSANGAAASSSAPQIRTRETWQQIDDEFLVLSSLSPASPHTALHTQERTQCASVDQCVDVYLAPGTTWHVYLR